MVDEMFKICYMEKWLMYIVLFVFDDFFGKDFLNDILYKIWKINIEKLMNCFKYFINYFYRFYNLVFI